MLESSWQHYFVVGNNLRDHWQGLVKYYRHHMIRCFEPISQSKIDLCPDVGGFSRSITEWKQQGIE